MKMSLKRKVAMTGLFALPMMFASGCQVPIDGLPNCGIYILEGAPAGSIITTEIVPGLVTLACHL